MTQVSDHKSLVHVPARMHGHLFRRALATPRAVSVTTMLAFAYVCAFVATLWVPFVVADAARRAPGALERGACVELIGRRGGLDARVLVTV